MSGVVFSVLGALSSGYQVDLREARVVLSASGAADSASVNGLSRPGVALSSILDAHSALGDAPGAIGDGLSLFGRPSPAIGVGPPALAADVSARTGGLSAARVGLAALLDGLPMLDDCGFPLGEAISVRGGGASWVGDGSSAPTARVSA